MSEDSSVKRLSGAMLFVICFAIGCIFLYWAVEYWVYNSFDANRYELSKIQVANSDSLSTWKLDKRTGNLEYCTKSYEKMDHVVCVRSVTIDAKEYSNAPEPLKAPEAPKPTASTSATTPAVQAPPAQPVATNTAVQTIVDKPATESAAKE